MIGDSDHIVAIADWVRDAPLINGAPPSKVSVSRQGVDEQILIQASAMAPRSRSAEEGLELAYLGSWSPLKGIDVAVRAVLSLPPDLNVRLSIHAPPGGTDERAYERSVRSLAAADDRIVFPGPVDRRELARTLAAYDALVVPSVCPETGPLVVLEAQAAGLFVGSRLGGIVEILDRDEAAVLVAAGDVAAWAAAIAGLAERRRHEPLPVPMKAARSMAAVASEMSELYSRLVDL